MTNLERRAQEMAEAWRVANPLSFGAWASWNEMTHGAHAGWLAVAALEAKAREEREGAMLKAADDALWSSGLKASVHAAVYAAHAALDAPSEPTLADAVEAMLKSELPPPGCAVFGYGEVAAVLSALAREREKARP